MYARPLTSNKHTFSVLYRGKRIAWGMLLGRIHRISQKHVDEARLGLRSRDSMWKCGKMAMQTCHTFPSIDFNASMDWFQTLWPSTAGKFKRLNGVEKEINKLIRKIKQTHKNTHTYTHTQTHTIWTIFGNVKSRCAFTPEYHNKNQHILVHQMHSHTQSMFRHYFLRCAVSWSLDFFLTLAATLSITLSTIKKNLFRSFAHKWINTISHSVDARKCDKNRNTEHT